MAETWIYIKQEDKATSETEKGLLSRAIGVKKIEITINNFMPTT